MAVTGWCAQCGAYVMTELDPQPGEWIDTGRIPRRLTLTELRDLAAIVTAKLSGPGWPEKDVPLQERYIPRRWKRGTLQKVGLTPNGHQIVLPADSTLPDQDQAEVPF